MRSEFTPHCKFTTHSVPSTAGSFKYSAHFLVENLKETCHCEQPSRGRLCINEGGEEGGRVKLIPGAGVCKYAFSPPVKMPCGQKHGEGGGIYNFSLQTGIREGPEQFKSRYVKNISFS